MEIKKAVVPKHLQGLRLDKFLSSYIFPNISRSKLKKLVKCVYVDGTVKDLAYKVKEGDVIEVILVPDTVEEPTLKPLEKSLEVLYSDEHIAVIVKPYGLVVHPGKSHEDDTLVNILIHMFGEKLKGFLGEYTRPGIVHRLDKEVFGVMVVALTDKAKEKLVEQFSTRMVYKEYHAIVEGRVNIEEMEIELPLARSKTDRKKVQVDFNEGIYAKTKYKVLERWVDYSLLQLHPITGRTHQLRVHLAYLGHPIVGDVLYGADMVRARKYFPQGGIALVSKKIQFLHPITGTLLKFEIDYPPEFQNLLKDIKSNLCL